MSAFVHTYALLLLVSGVALLGTGLVPGQGKVSRVLTFLVGLGFLCYGGYLLFLFKGGTVTVYFKVFVIPILLIVNAVRSAISNKKEAAQVAYAHQQQAWSQQQPQQQWAPQPQQQAPPQYQQQQWAPQGYPQDNQPPAVP